MPASSHRLTPVRALLLWVAYSIVFAVAGGLGAGIPALVFDLVSAGEGYDDTLYAIMFGVTGYIAYRLARHVLQD